MYEELPLIAEISNMEDKVRMLLLFIQEYSGWKNHLVNIGATWGAANEEAGAERELFKVNKHLEKLEKIIISCFDKKWRRI